MNHARLRDLRRELDDARADRAAAAILMLSVPPVTLNTARSDSVVFVNVVNCAGVGAASSCAMNDHTSPDDR
jgi:hypothetical protein